MQITSIFQKYPNPPPNYPLSKHLIHGFSGRPSPAQIVSYLLICFSIAVYFSCVIPLHFSIALLVLYSIFGTILVITTLYATICDPTDRVVYYYKWSQHDKKIIFAPDYSKVLFCDSCDSYCLSSSKHCRSCNRCVDNFDHHCKWFNNCVGERNYNHFFISILSTFTYLIIVIVHVAISSAYVDYSNRYDLIKIILAWIAAALLGICAFLLFNLIILHIYLLLTGQTTFMFLQRKKKEEQQNQKRETQKADVSGASRASIIPIDAGYRVQEQETVSKQQIVMERKKTNVILPTLPSGRKVSNQFLTQKTEQVNRNAKQNQPQVDKTVNQQSLQSYTVMNNELDLARNSSNDIQLTQKETQGKLPPFLLKNRSLKLLLSSSQVQIPSNRSLQPVP